MSALILAIDTALSACSVAMTSDGDALISRIEPMARGQAERLAPMVAELMGEVGIDFNQLTTIAVTKGPGAFTGVRVGLAFGRGLAIALGKPCVGLSTLEVLAKGARQPKTLAAISVAGSVFVGAWDGQREVIAPCRALNLDELLDGLQGAWAITGPGHASIQHLRPDWIHIDQNLPDPLILAQLAHEANPATHLPDPLYLRGVEAKLPGGLLLPPTGS